MRLYNCMPYDRCETCEDCVLSVHGGNDSTGERIVIVTCKHSKKCKRKEREEKNSED